MSFTPKVTEYPKRHVLTETADGWNATRVFCVLATSDRNAKAVLAAEEDIERETVYRNPQGEQAHSNLRARTITAVPKSPTPVGGSGLWDVTVNYSTKDSTRIGNAGTGGPRVPEPFVGSPPVYLWSRGSESTTAEKDLDGVEVVNTASPPELVDPLPTINLPARVLTVRWYVASYSMATLLQYDGAVNSKPWKARGGLYTFEKGQVLCDGIDPHEEETGLTLMEGVFRFRPGGRLWHPTKVANTTFVDGVRKPLDLQGNVHVPVGGEPKIYYIGANPTSLTEGGLRFYPLRDFNNLGI